MIHNSEPYYERKKSEAKRIGIEGKSERKNPPKERQGISQFDETIEGVVISKKIGETFCKSSCNI
jgi:hypothetical protein